MVQFLNPAQQILEKGIFRLQLNLGLHPLHGLLDILLVNVDPHDQVERLQVIGLQGKGLFQLPQGFLALALGQQAPDPCGNNRPDFAGRRDGFVKGPGGAWPGPFS